MRYAFEPAAAAGGFAGATVLAALRYGVAHGIFSNEAGLGLASIAHAQARNTPGGQGALGIWEVAIDTLVIGTMTALVILVTGVIETGTAGAELASQAYATALPGIGGLIVLLSLVLFSYTTMLTWGFYGEQSFRYLFGRSAVMPYRVAFLSFIFIGAIGGLATVWDFADTLNGLMAAPNLIALIALAGVVVREGRTFRCARLTLSDRPLFAVNQPRADVQAPCHVWRAVWSNKSPLNRSIWRFRAAGPMER